MQQTEEEQVLKQCNRRYRTCMVFILSRWNARPLILYRKSTSSSTWELIDTEPSSMKERRTRCSDVISVPPHTRAAVMKIWEAPMRRWCCINSRYSGEFCNWREISINKIVADEILTNHYAATNVYRKLHDESYRVAMPRNSTSQFCISQLSNSFDTHLASKRGLKTWYAHEQLLRLPRTWSTFIEAHPGVKLWRPRISWWTHGWRGVEAVHGFIAWMRKKSALDSCLPGYGEHHQGIFLSEYFNGNFLIAAGKIHVGIFAAFHFASQYH